MRFNEKVSLVLNEVFDRDPQKLKSLGIEPIIKNGDYDYVFRDPKLGAKSPYYKVNITNDPPRMSQLFRAILSEYPGSVGMGLTWGNKPNVIENFDKTGLKNEVFVYSVMINCLTDYVDRHGDAPAFLNFSGYSDDMNIVYDRFMKRFLDEPALHKYAYIPYREDYYISKAVYDSIVAGESGLSADLVKHVKENVVKKSDEKEKQLKFINLQKGAKRIIKRVLQCPDDVAEQHVDNLATLDGVYGVVPDRMKATLKGDFSALKAAMLDKLKDRGAVADAMDQIGKILQDMKAAYTGDDDIDDDD
jgi:putative sterol carrier protein